MLTSIRVNDDSKVCAEDADKNQAPFKCPVCGRETILRKGLVKTHHFAHKPPVLCEYGRGESESHRKCKQDIFNLLKISPKVTECELEKNLGSVISDIYFCFLDIKIAIEVQVSSLTVEQIINRTQKYEKLGIYVLWLPLFNKNLNDEKYAPKQWEKWLHSLYFGRVYYWMHGLSIKSIRFAEYMLWVEDYQEYGGYHKKSKRYKTPQKDRTLNLLEDFQPRTREFWKSGNIYVPKSKILLDRYIDSRGRH